MGNTVGSNVILSSIEEIRKKKPGKRFQSLIDQFEIAKRIMKQVGCPANIQPPEIKPISIAAGLESMVDDELEALTPGEGFWGSGLFRGGNPKMKERLQTAFDTYRAQKDLYYSESKPNAPLGRNGPAYSPPLIQNGGSAGNLKGSATQPDLESAATRTTGQQSDGKPQGTTQTAPGTSPRDKYGTRSLRAVPYLNAANIEALREPILACIKGVNQGGNGKAPYMVLNFKGSRGEGKGYSSLSEIRTALTQEQGMGGGVLILKRNPVNGRYSVITLNDSAKPV